ncbi:MAG: class I SAM-dependent methyltransferase, partial [Bacteroidetes bacterium]
MDHLLRTLAAVPPGCCILDLGCGTGLRAEPLARLGFDLHACDLDADAVAHARRRLAPLLPDDAPDRRITRLSRLDALDYEDASFDWVVAGDLLAHAHRDGVLPTLLHEIRRVLKPGGWL